MKPHDGSTCEASRCWNERDSEKERERGGEDATNTQERNGVLAESSRAFRNLKRRILDKRDAGEVATAATLARDNRLNICSADWKCPDSGRREAKVDVGAARARRFLVTPSGKHGTDW